MINVILKGIKNKIGNKEYSVTNFQQSQKQKKKKECIALKFPLKRFTSGW